MQLNADLLEDKQSSSVGIFDIAQFTHVLEAISRHFIKEIRTFEDYLAQNMKIIKKWCFGVNLQTNNEHETGEKGAKVEVWLKQETCGRMSIHAARIQ